MKISIYSVLVLLLTFFSSEKSIAQKYSFTNYSVKNGLPSSEVYYAFQDSKGYMWFATDAGVSRFNGYEFENFDTSDGLTDNDIFYITEDNKKRIWFGTYNCQLSYFKNDSIYPFKYNDVLNDSLIGTYRLVSFDIDKYDNIWMGFLNKGLKKIDNQGNFQSISKQDIGIDNVYIIKQEEKIFYGLSTGKTKKDKYLGTSFFYQDITTNEKKHFKSNITPKYIDSHVILADSCSSSFLIKARFDLFYYFNQKNNSFKQLFLPKNLLNTRINGLFWEKEYLYFSTNHGVFKCSIKSDSIIIQENFLKEERVAKVFKDSEAGYWFQTLENGTIYSPSLLISNNNMKSLIDKKDQVSNLEIDEKGNLFFVVEGKGLFVRNQLSGKIQKLSTTKKDQRITIFYNPKFKRTFINTNSNSYYYKNGKIVLQKNILNVFGKIIIEDSSLFYTGGNGYFYVHNPHETIFSRTQEFLVTDLCKYQNKIWVGTTTGIKLYQNKKITDFTSDSKYTSSAITKIKELNDSILLIGTRSNGLLVIKRDSIVDIINEGNGIINNLIRTIHVDNEGTIWIGTSTGISRINYNSVGDYAIYNLTKKQGFSSEINKIDSYKNTIYLATKKGLQEFDRNNILTNIIPPPLYITSFIVNEKEKDITNNNHFSYTENNVNIKYEALNYKSLGDIEYQYRLVGTTTKWEVTTTRNVRYSALKPGKYIFEIIAKNEDGIQSKMASISLTINPPFWLTWWFLSLAIIIVVALIYFTIKYQLKQIKKKNTIEKKMIELELKALRSQMNPHFIFNTLNSIQDFIGENNFKETNRYITMFSMLIRTVLNLSEKGLITIYEEVEMLRLYLDLEKIRFDEQFDYKIIVSNELDDDYDKIPSMLLQPYIENAIWHGLMNNTKKGLITIDIAIENKFLKCIITDNGIGRERANEIKLKRNINHKSLGMSITKERLDLLNVETKGDVNVDIIDLYENKNGTKVGKGTKVIVKIPL